MLSPQHYHAAMAAAAMTSRQYRLLCRTGRDRDVGFLDIAWPIAAGCVRTAFVLTFALGLIGQPKASLATESARVQGASIDLSEEPIQPLPLSIDLDRRKVKLGQRLFNDPRLSANGRISCTTCHDLRQAGVIQGQRYAPPGVSGKAVPLNVPTVFNSGFNFLQFWDGRARTLEEQIDGPLHNPDEMGTNWSDALARIGTDNAYRKAFDAIYGEVPTEFAVKDAIANYERSLITPNAPFDKYLRGDASALSSDAKRGYELFKDYGCSACHQGVNVGGNMVQAFGIMDQYFEERGGLIKQDLGRFNVTGDADDRHVFKVPSLRGVALTFPYFHDGSAETLKEAVEIMARYQLGRELTSVETGLLVVFLESLTGVYTETAK